MRHLKISSAAAALIIAAASLQSTGAFAAEYFHPKYTDFNSNDVNGTVTLEFSGDVSADILVTFDSPEVNDAEYYHEKISKSGSYAFEIEGRDTTKNDFRNYKLTVSVDGAEMPYTDNFNIPDGDDNPDSFAEYTYTFDFDNEFTGKPWDITATRDEMKKEITFHLNTYVLGDVDSNGSVNAADASAVLREYSALSTGGKSTLTPAQSKAADVNGDSSINSTDASAILRFYSINSTGGKADWSEILKK